MDVFAWFEDLDMYTSLQEDPEDPAPVGRQGWNSYTCDASYRAFGRANARESCDLDNTGWFDTEYPVIADESGKSPIRTAPFFR